MGRELKRVKLNFDYPLNEVWIGYIPKVSRLKFNFKLLDKVPKLIKYDSAKSVCDNCNKYYKCNENADYCIMYKQEYLWSYDPPEGNGYQLWSTTSGGSPISPVFETMSGLAKWCSRNATIFGDIKLTEEQWMNMFIEDDFIYKIDNVIFG